MRIISSAIFIFFACIEFSGQQPAPTPPPNPPPTTNQTPRAVRVTRPSGINSMGFPASLESPPEVDSLARRQMILQKYAFPMYRKPSDRELKEMSLDASVIAKYGELLRRPDSGIFKLVPDSGCAENTRVLNASEICLKYSLPGAGNSFSFRTENYRIRHLADVTYNSGSLWVTGILLHGILVDIGDVALDSVTLDLPPLGFVRDFKPAADFKEATETDEMLVRGVRKDGYLYRRNLPVVENHTYVLRSIAYRGKVMKSIRGADFNELDFDKRKDVIAVFKVVDVADDESITIIWHTLRIVPSQKLRIPERGHSDDTETSPLVPNYQTVGRDSRGNH